MTQNDCLQLEHHFTHLGVCYPGDVAWIQLSNPQDPQPVDFHTNGGTSLPEPSTIALLAVALVMAAVYTACSRWRYRSE